ncbi:MAG: toxin-antitoxin system YwqK family antitoxin, partial [Pseudomonadota bacterium]
MTKYSTILLLILIYGCGHKVEKTPQYSTRCDSVQHFYRGDTLIASIQIANGKFNGFATSFVENAGFKTEAFYNNGKLHGDLRVFSSEGNLVQTGQYCMGYKCGKWLDFHEDGTLKRLQLFSIDERSQLLAEWDSQSNMKNLSFNIKILRFGSDSIFIQRERLPELQVFINDGERATEVLD